MAGHTPGTWNVGGPSHGGTGMDDGGDYAIYVERNGVRHIIAEAFSLTAENNREPSAANARLIAAAPELLAALQKIVRDWDGEPEDMIEACAAIAKATTE